MEKESDFFDVLQIYLLRMYATGSIMWRKNVDVFERLISGIAINFLGLWWFIVIFNVALIVQDWRVDCFIDKPLAAQTISWLKLNASNELNVFRNQNYLIFTQIDKVSSWRWRCDALDIIWHQQKEKIT